MIGRIIVLATCCVIAVYFAFITGQLAKEREDAAFGTGITSCAFMVLGVIAWHSW